MKFDVEINATVDIPEEVITDLTEDVAREYDIPKNEIVLGENDELDWAIESFLEDSLDVSMYYDGDAWLCSITSYSPMG